MRQDVMRSFSSGTTGSLCQEMGYTDWRLCNYSGYLKLGHDHFNPHSFQFMLPLDTMQSELLIVSWNKP
jgi:hypothetical protein